MKPNNIALAALMLIGISTLTNISDAAAKGGKKAVNGFMGHYGYFISYPADYKSQPSFSGPDEIVQFMPPTKCTADQAACAKAGWINLAVFPKRLIKEKNGLGSFDEYMGEVLRDSKKRGENPTAKRSKIGSLTSNVLFLKNPTGPFNRMAYLEGQKCYYRFAYDAKNKHVVEMMQSLAEIQPHDTPPAGR